MNTSAAHGKFIGQQQQQQQAVARNSVTAATALTDHVDGVLEDPVVAAVELDLSVHSPPALSLQLRHPGDGRPLLLWAGKKAGAARSAPVTGRYGHAQSASTTTGRSWIEPASVSSPGWGGPWPGTDMEGRQRHAAGSSPLLPIATLPCCPTFILDRVPRAGPWSH